MGGRPASPVEMGINTRTCERAERKSLRDRVALFSCGKNSSTMDRRRARRLVGKQHAVVSARSDTLAMEGPKRWQAISELA